MPDRELSAGVAEIIKYGLIRDVDFLDWLEKNISRVLAREPDALAYAIERSCQNKAQVVAADEHESGVRAILNLGHTFGHAIETGLGYGVWLHGEAVAAGMVVAAELSKLMGWLDESDVGRIRGLLERAKLPVGMPETLTTPELLQLMAIDKKAESGKMRYVVLRDMGHATVESGIATGTIAQAVDACR